MTIDNLIKLYGQLCDMNQCILWISPEYNDQPAVTSHLTLPTHTEMEEEQTVVSVQLLPDCSPQLECQL